MPVSRRVVVPLQALGSINLNSSDPGFGSINLNIVSSLREAAAARRSRRVENSGAGGVAPARKSHMSLRQRSFQFVENNSNYVVHVTRGQQRRRFEVSRLALFGGAALLSLVGAAVIAARLSGVPRRSAGRADRTQTQMQYAYEDRLAAARLRLDQVASRQFIDSDGVEGKVRSLVIRQAMLETAPPWWRAFSNTRCRPRRAPSPRRACCRRRRRRLDSPPEYRPSQGRRKARSTTARRRSTASPGRRFRFAART